MMWNAAGPFFLTIMRGAATSTFYNYNIGLNSHATITTLAGTETYTTGGCSVFWKGQRKVITHKEGTNRLMAMNLGSRQMEPLATLPYAAPAAYDGKRLRQIRTSDGVDWLYYFRPVSNELFRVPMEWGLL
jgi:hypothetical protein